MDPSLWMEDLGDLGDLIQAVDQAEPGDRLDVDYDDDGNEFSGEEGEGFEDPDSFFHPIPHHEQLAGPQPSQNLPPTTQHPEAFAQFEGQVLLPSQDLSAEDLQQAFVHLDSWDEFSLHQDQVVPGEEGKWEEMSVARPSWRDPSTL